MNANKGVFGVNLGHMWDEIDRMQGWGEALLELAARGIVKPKVAASFKFERLRRRITSSRIAAMSKDLLSRKGERFAADDTGARVPQEKSAIRRL